MTINTPDLYGGAATTTQNAVREVGTATWTDVAGAASFSANPYSTYEIIFGIDSDDDDAEPYGPKKTFTVPCAPYPTVSAEVVDDSLYTDLTVRAWDPEDGTVISSSAPVDIDNGDVFNIKVEWQGAFEEDYGNRYCDLGNVATVEYPTGNYTSIKLADINGNVYPTAPTPTLESISAGDTTKSFYVPTIESNGLWTFYVIVDASGSGKEPSGYETTGNFTVNLYDVNWYFDNDVSPSQVKCGVEDEDGADVGATGADTLDVYITVD